MDKNFVIIAYIVYASVGAVKLTLDLIGKGIDAYARRLIQKRSLKSLQTPNNSAKHTYDRTDYNYSSAEKVLALNRPSPCIKSFIHNLYVIKDAYYRSRRKRPNTNSLTMSIQKVKNMLNHCVNSIRGVIKRFNTN